MKLGDFQQPSLLVSDYNLEDFEMGVSIPRKSAAQIAAVDTLTNPEGSTESFRQQRESLMSPEGRRAFLDQQEIKRAQIAQDLHSEIVGILIDPQINDERKQIYIEGIQGAPETYKLLPLDNFVQTAAIDDGSPKETEQQHQTRMSAIDSIREVNQVKRGQVAALNAVSAGKNEDATEIGADLVELMIPFAEWNDVNQMYQDIIDGDEILMGSQREKLYEAMLNMPYNKRAEFSEKLIEYVSAHDQVILPDGNDLAAVSTITQMMSMEDYSNFDKWFDNTISILEITGVFGVVARAAKTGRLSRTIKRATQTEVSPTSPSQLIKETNPEKARAMHETAMADASDEAAEALYGSTRDDAAAKDLLPEPQMEPGEVEIKVEQWGPNNPEPEYLRALRETDGQTYLSENEVRRALDSTVSDLENVEGMVVNPSETVIKQNSDGSFGISMMYHPRDTGFKSGSDAILNATYAFRNYGLEASDFTLYRREGDKWLQTTPRLLDARAALRDEFIARGEDVPARLQDTDFAVGIDYNYRIRPEDIQGYDLLSTGTLFGKIPLNFLDRAPATPVSPAARGQGSLTQNLLDSASVLHPQITEPAMVAVDRGVAIKKAYVDTFKEFTDGWKRMATDRKALMTEYIHKANLEGIKFDTTDLMARGFDEKEISLLRQWRKANDYMFVAANADMAKTLANRGYRLFLHAESDTRLVVKPMKRGSVTSQTPFYDVASGEIRLPADKDALDRFYEQGGTYAQLSEPIQVGDDWIDVVRVSETKDGGFMRAINPNDRVLSYRDGYYPVMYDANFFVYKTITTSDGRTFDKVVGSAKNTQDAENLVRMLRTQDPEAVVDFRPDRRSPSEKASSFDEMGWNVGVNAGISAQRVRGERLVDASGDLHNAGMSNLMDPLEAVANQINQLSSRVSMRNYLDTTKRRWLDNYSDLLKLETDRTGHVLFPSSIEQIKGVAGADPQLVADARSMFNYIYSLENGYINGIDESFKAVFNFAANIFAGNSKWLEEKFLSWGEGSQTSAAKSAAFKLYLASNPTRQLLIQGHQAVQLAPLNPGYISGPMQWDLFRIGRAMRGYEGDAEAVEMLNELRMSGMMEAVDANNLVRQDTLRLADQTISQKAGTAASKPFDIMQKVGFDTAEQFVLVTSWLAHRDLAVKAGRKLTRREYDDIVGKARAYTYSMNRAGDMPYNRNSLNVIAQFMQVPHKAFLQQFTNRSLTPTQRKKLLAWNAVMYGVPTGALGTWFYNTFEPGPARDALERGLEHVILNEVASAITGEEQQVDWGDLAPADLHGMYDTLYAIWTTDGIADILLNTPSGSLIAGSNPRIQNALGTAARWVHLKDDYDDPELNTKFTDVATAFLSMSSGFSNAFKAQYAWESGMKISSLGNISDSDVTKFEAAMQMFGFRTETETGVWEINRELYAGRSFDAGQGGDVDKWYAALKGQLARRGLTVAEQDIAQRILTEGWRVFQNDPEKFYARLENLIKNDVNRNEFDIFDKVLDQIGWEDTQSVLKLLEKLPESEDKEFLREAIKGIGEYDG